MVRSALLENAELLSHLGKDKYGNVPIYQLAAGDPAKFPRITFFEVDNNDSEFADDKPIGSTVVVQIDVWNQGGSTSAISGEVDKTMKMLGFFRSSGPDFYEDDTKVFHKALRYRTVMPEEN
jgi:hypothetical protein